MCTLVDMSIVASILVTEWPATLQCGHRRSVGFVRPDDHNHVHDHDDDDDVRAERTHPQLRPLLLVNSLKTLHLISTV